LVFAGPPPALNFVYVSLLALAFCAVEYLVGGTRLVFSLPAEGLFAVAALVSVVDLRRSKVRPNGVCLASSALFFGYVLLRAIYSPVAYLAWFDEYMVLGALIVYLITACYFTDPRRRVWLLLVLLVIAGANLAVAARQFTVGDDYMFSGFIRSTAYRGRGSGFYICPDHLAGFLEVVGSLSLAIAIWSRQALWLRLLLGYGAVCCFGGILLTASRGGALAATAALLTLAGLGLLRAGASSPRAVFKGLIVILSIVAIAAIALLAAVRGSSVLQTRARMFIDKRDIRLLLWPAAIKQYELSPIVGTGAATYRYYGRLFRDPRVQADPIRTHNDYLELLAEYGAAGAAGLVFFLGAHLLWGWRTFRLLSARQEIFALRSLGAGSNAAAWNIGALAAVASFMVHSVVDFNLHIPANTFLLAFVFGVLANPGRNLFEGEHVPSERLRKVDLLPRLALPALGVWIIAWGLPKLPGEYYCEQARIALREKRNLAALRFAQLGLERETQNPDLYFYLGEARQNVAGEGPDTPINRSYREASLEPYRAAVRLYPEDSSILLRLGEALTRLGDIQSAGRVFDQALRWDPNSSVVYTYYGFFLTRAGRVAEASLAYQKALALGYTAAASEGLNQLSRQRQTANAAE
jgi:O-antigen ligase